MSSFRLLVAFFVALAVLPSAALAQERGTVTGAVIDAATQQPLAGAQILIVGTQIGTITNQTGRYLIPNVPAGTREVRATLIGYTQGSQTVSVAAGETATANFALQQTAVALEGLVVTATGEVQRRREIGNAVGNINVADVELAAVTSFSQLLTARSPGVTVQAASGTTGGSQRIRIRGSASVSLSNEPLLIIDGVRVNNSAEGFSIGVGGQDISRLNDLNPDEIENVEILKGPAAAALYGTAAANGVIQITTRRGRAGAPRWTVYSEGGYLWDPTDYPANYGRRGIVGAQTVTNQCTLFRISTGSCREPSDELLVFSPLEAEDPFRHASNIFGIDRAGSRGKLGASVAGGGDQLTYFLSADRENELGIYPNNDLERVSLRANVSANLRDDLDVTVSTGWINNEITLPQNDNNLLGQMGSALLGRAVDDPNLRGYAAATPRQIEQYDVRQGTRRFTGGVNTNYRPLPWLSVVGQAGLDGLFRHDNATLPANTVPFGTWPEGWRVSNRAEVVNVTSTLGGTASYNLTELITGQSSAGFQYHRELFQRTDAFGAQLLPGTRRLPGTSARFSVNEVFTDNRTVGAYLQQQLGFQDRIFLTGALRGDDNSAFGADFGLVIYPSLSFSWVVAEEPWFPVQDVLSSLRLRAAVGSSGLRPSFRDAISFFTPVGATVEGQDVPAFTIGGIGDPLLRPEFSTEFEAGFDAGFFGERAGLELTYYNKRSRDALVFRRLAPSVGAARGELGNQVTGRFENIGRVSNAGWEFLVRLQPLDLRQVRWDLTGTFSTNRNRLIELGEGIEPIIFGLGGASQRHQPGHPLGGYWGRQLVSFDDADGDGIIQPSEVVLSDTAEFLGNPNPTREFSVSTSATLFDLVRLSALIDGKGGYMLNNSTRYFRCASAFVNCREAFDPSAPLFDQARVVAASRGFREVYFEDASFVKLREVALTLMAPQPWTRGLRLDGVSLTLAGRNLHTWTDYTGFDPELNFAGGANFSVADFLTQPPLRYFTARINVNF